MGAHNFESGGRGFESRRARQLAHCPHNCFVHCVGELLPRPARRGSVVEARTVFAPSSIRSLSPANATDGHRGHGSRDVDCLHCGVRHTTSAKVLFCLSEPSRYSPLGFIASLSPDAIGEWQVKSLFE